MEPSELAAMVDDFANRSFRDMADDDYIAARMALRVELVPQFLWSSLQAIEKYLKAILLLNRTPSTRATHGVSALLTRVENIRKLQFRISAAAREFVDYLDMYGRFRYLEVSYYGRGGESSASTAPSGRFGGTVIDWITLERNPMER
jgi:HEPN domain-containing protein